MTKRAKLTGLVLLVLVAAAIALTNCAGFYSARISRTTTSTVDSDRELAREVILRTDQVLDHAKEVVINNRVFTGKLADAYSNQEFAYDLFRQADYQSAMQHSLYARRLAQEAIAANQGKRRDRDFEDERRIRPRGDGQLNDDLRRNRPNQARDDQDVLSLRWQFRF